MIPTRHMYYHDAEKFDLQKMRADAHRMSVGDSVNKPREVLIHHHKVEQKCENRQHESFPEGGRP